MKTLPSLAVLAVVTSLGSFSPALFAAEEEGVALAIVYDTSGSMNESVSEAGGRAAPKYVIANRALMALANQIQTFATNNAAGSPRKIEAGLFVFKGQDAREAIKFGPFDAAAFHKFARSFATPNGNTPLGNALNTASQRVLKSPLSRKHVLVISDGMSNTGPTPSAVLSQLKAQAAQQQSSVAVHFVAFDVDAKEFNSVKKQGATVVSAADEKQLNTQLDYILQHKILLEEEEPKTH